jgi:FAD binding domain
MTDQQVTTTRGADSATSLLAESAVLDLKARLRGTLFRAAEAGYDQARKIWNGMIDRRPALIASCAGVADVIACINFARTHDLLVSVRGGGHNIAGNAVCDGGLMINLSGMKGVRVDPVRRTARAEPGLTWGEFDHETQAFGLATTGGQISTTGIAGLTLGGGWGYLARQHGLLPTISSPPISSPLAAGFSELAAKRTPIFSGACVAAEAISVSSPRLSIDCIRSARCWPD